MIKRISILFFLVALFNGCHLFEELIDNNNNYTDIDTNFEVLWRADGFGIDGNDKGLIDNNILYVIEAYYDGICAIDMNHGSILWQKSDILDPASNILLYEDNIYIRDNYNEASVDIGGILVLDKYTGNKIGYIQPSILFFDYNDKAVQLSEYWLEQYNNYLYMPIRSRDISIKSGIYRLDLNKLDLSAESRSYPDIELFVEEDIKQRISTIPLFEGERAYFYIGGSGRKYEEGSGYTLEQCYTQDVVEMLCTDLEGNVLWQNGFENIGAVSAGPYKFIMQNNYLYVSDISGLAKIDKITGKIIYDRAIPYDNGNSPPQFLIFDNDRLYYNFHNSIKSTNAKNGEELWEFDTKYSNDTNPIIFGDLVYNVDAESLRAFNKKTGKIVYEDKSLGIDGFRIVGYIPYKDDVIYILDREEIIAVRLKE